MTALSRYRKTVAAVLGAAGTWCLAALPDSHITTMEWVALAIAVLTAAGVYSVPNDAPAGDVPDPAVSERGATAVSVIGAVLLLILIFVLFGAVHSPLVFLLLAVVLLVLFL